MDMQLSNKRALITGSTKGIGNSVAHLLAAEGARVIVTGRNRDEAQAVAHDIGQLAEAISADISTLAGVEALAHAALATGPVEILVNNAGIFEPKVFLDIPDSDWLRFYEVNVLSGVRLSRLLLPPMLLRNWGRILFVSSESAINIPAEMIHYGMTKTAQLAVSRGIAETTKGTGVTVNSVLPGPTLSDGVGTFVRKMAEDQGVSPEQMEQQFFKTARPTSLLQRFAHVEEVANMIVYLCSPLASATNGAAVRCDGGVVKSIY